jgi:hypothetical protein
LDEKLELIQAHQDDHSLNDCLEALGVSKGTWHYRMRSGSKRQERQVRDEVLKPKVVQIIKDHPDYGYRRIQPDLEAEVEGAVNHKRLRRLLNQWDLALHRSIPRPKASRVLQILRQAKGHLNLAAGMDPGPLELLSTDFTEIPFDGGNRKAYLIAMVDVNSDWVPGWAVGLSKDTTLALEGWREVVEGYGTFGRDVAGMWPESWSIRIGIRSSPAMLGSGTSSWTQACGSPTRSGGLWTILGSSPSGPDSRGRTGPCSRMQRTWWTSEVSSIGKCGTTTAHGDTRAWAIGHHWPT